ncbi:MAG: glutamate--tRNA ligase, partial [Myxococcales bacterium]|nr:glutamate--tRNA ligase [Myxococcales bacterium]
MSEVRTRVAPSPTGDPHVGTAYVALFNYCFARVHGGKFILRIEDTDQKRSTEASERAILDALRWTGLQWDEGPDVGGPHGPYRQSERSELYREHARQLLETGHAFRCFCTAERLGELRKQQIADGSGLLGYDGHCMGLSADEAQRRADAGEAHVVRLIVPREGACRVDDMLRGPIEIPWTQVDMQVLLKSDGLPTYHLANVVDDHHMGISHVLRGEEWINSAPKHLRLYEAFGWEPPVLCHLPLLRNPDQSKLSKRKNPTGILWYRDMGIVPEALLNYLGSIAWSMPGEVEVFSLDEMAAVFDASRISLGGPIFDLEKLTWINRKWLRERIDDADLVERLIAWKLNRDFLAQVAALARTRLDTLGSLADIAGFLAMGRLPLPDGAFEGMAEPGELAERFVMVEEQLNVLPGWDKDAI